MITTAFTIYRLEDFEVYASKRRMVKNDETLTLNAKAFDLLLVLVENSERVLSKEELLEKVWADQFVEENNLTVQISALRKVLGERKNAPRFLVNIPGKGYKFIAEVQILSAEEKK